MSIPMRPMFWKILLELAPSRRTTSGGIALPDQVVEADEHFLCVGKLVGIGELCFKRVVDESLHYGRQTLPKIGDWIVFGRHSGQKIKPRDDTQPTYIILSETDIQGVTDDPSQFKSYV